MENDLLIYKAKCLLEYSVERTATALSTIVHREVAATMVGLTSYANWLDCFQSEQQDQSGHTIMLKTEVVGPFSGINYCLLSKEEMTRIGESCLPDDLTVPGSGTLLVEFLKEMENILAAVTISGIADQLKVSLYGDVPKIEAVATQERVNVISKEVSNVLPHLVFESQLNIQEIDVSFDFLWFFDHEFTRKIESMNEFECMEKLIAQP